MEEIEFRALNLIQLDNPSGSIIKHLGIDESKWHFIKKKLKDNDFIASIGKNCMTNDSLTDYVITESGERYLEFLIEISPNIHTFK